MLQPLNLGLRHKAGQLIVLESVQNLNPGPQISRQERQGTPQLALGQGVEVVEQGRDEGGVCTHRLRSGASHA